MKPPSIVAILLISLLLIGVDAEAKKKISCKAKTPCKSTLDDCPKEGCTANNTHDPELNKLKNLKSSTKPVEDRTITEIIKLEKKIIDSGYKQGQPRTVLRDLGEGSQVRVVGYLLAAKQECGESCNCGLQKVDVTTDNHLVLVNPKVVTDNPLPEPATQKQIKAVFKKREPHSMTAEFTPRVREDGHPNFTSDVQDLINKTRQGALWVN